MVNVFNEDTMKYKLIFLVCIMLALALAFSCSQNSTGPGDFPDDPFEWFSFSYIMEIDVSNSKGVEIEVISWDSLTTGELIINGYTAPLEISGWFFYWIYSPVFDSTFTPLNPGDSISYTLAVNGNNYSGGMNITYQPDISWPDTFDITQDYSFSWNILEEPGIYLCKCDVGYHNEEYKENTWTFTGHPDEYTISKKYYNDYDEIDDLWIALATYNYYNFGSCFVYSTGLVDKRYTFWKNQNNQDQRMLQFHRLQALLKAIE